MPGRQADLTICRTSVEKSKLGQTLAVARQLGREPDIAILVLGDELGQSGVAEMAERVAAREGAAGHRHHRHAHPHGLERRETAAVRSAVEADIDIVVAVEQLPVRRRSLDGDALLGDPGLGEAAAQARRHHGIVELLVGEHQQAEVLAPGVTHQSVQVVEGLAVVQALFDEGSVAVGTG